MNTSLSLSVAIEVAVGFLRGGGVVACPTDTLYGLGADVFCNEAVERVYAIKGRSREAPLPLLIGSVEDLEQVAMSVPDLAWRLIKRFWPGPLTLVLIKSPEVPYLVTAGRESVAVRMPDHDVPLSLVRGLGRPITGTSANPTGGPDPITANDVRRMLGEKVDYILDGGPATAGSPSTIVDLTGIRPRVVREGPISCQSLRSAYPLDFEGSLKK